MLQAYTYLAPNMYPVFAAVTDYLARTLNTDSRLITSTYDSPLLDPAIMDGKFDLAFLCGLPLTIRNVHAPRSLIPIAAPVPIAARYQDKPIYFADVMVRADSSYQTFEDLRGSRFCYNDPGSNSGYNVLRYFMLEHGYIHGFFREVFQSGSHQKSLTAIGEGRADCACIDTHVFDRAVQLDPSLHEAIRTVQVLGPFPMPPLAANAELGDETIQRLRTAMQNASADEQMAAVMREADIARYELVEADDYLVLGDMARTAHERGFDTIR